jgi:hypothetical protein
VPDPWAILRAMSMRHNFLVTCLVLVACGGDDGDSDTNNDPSTSGSATMTAGNTLSTTEDPSSESSETVDPSDTVDPSSDTSAAADSSSSDTTASADSSSSGNPVGPDCSLGDGPTFAVSNAGSADYVIDGVNDPALTVVRGCTYTFDVSASGHPFFINTVQGTGTDNAYDAGVTGNGTESGQIVWEVAVDAPDSLFYNCEFHDGMTSTITVISGE